MDVSSGGAGGVDLTSIDKFDEEFEALFKLEFADSFNSWLNDTLELANRQPAETPASTVLTNIFKDSKENVNQISRFFIYLKI